MKNLLYKEFHLDFHPSFFFFLLFGALLLIPSWPYFIAFGYTFIIINNLFVIGRSNKDVLFTASLPIRKKDVVRSRVYAVAVFELLQIAVAVPFAIMNNTFYPEGNMAGTNVNFAFFGFVLILYGLFNLVFLPGFYKTAYKSGLPIIIGILVATAFAIAVTTAVLVIPTLSSALNGLGAENLACQLPVLAAGAALFILFTHLAFRLSAARFEKVDL